MALRLLNILSAQHVSTLYILAQLLGSAFETQSNNKFIIHISTAVTIAM
jgi:hypothetical protein